MGTEGYLCKFMFKCISNCQIKNYNIYIPRWEFWFCPHLHQDLIFSDFISLAMVLSGEVSQCSFNIYDIEHFFMCLLAITVSSSFWSVFKLLPVLKMGVSVFSTEL